MKHVLCALMLAMVGIGSALASPPANLTSDSDPFVGAWKLNPQKSRYPRGACPRDMIIVMEKAGTGIHYRSETTYADGRFARADYTAQYDGPEVLVAGSTGFLLPVSLKRVDSHTVIARYSRGLQAVATSRRVVSRDGRFMTVTTTSPDSSGRSFTSVGVYERTGRAGGGQ